ncbi:MAG: hypothetical protein HY846_02640 [Nitrosomonadales bacterium]|nr:hypothetical protein [Nitrosomonadales bacterium]
MDTILGLAVLTSPLFLIIAWLPISIWLARNLVKWIGFRNGAVSLVAGLLGFVLVFMLPFADEIAGQLYLNHLCSTEAGVKVYQTVELPAEYWDGRGRPRFIAPNGFVDMKLLPNRFEWRNVDEPYIDSVIKVKKSRWQFIDKESRVILGERISYMRYFGWLNRFSPAPNIGEGCRNLGGEFNRNELLRKEREQDQMFFLGVFKPATSTR